MISFDTPLHKLNALIKKTKANSIIQLLVCVCVCVDTMEQWFRKFGKIYQDQQALFNVAIIIEFNGFVTMWGYILAA